MTVFGSYSKYYDLLYKDKDYEKEVDYVHSIIQKYAPGAKTILDLGCGTGRHDFLLAKKGYSITGVDRSEEMLSVANANLSSSTNNQLLVSFHKGNIRSIRLGRTYDVVISLFHVMNYLPTNDDLNAAFATVKTHLKPHGLFIFDCWYGPAVLTNRPVMRVKRVEDKSIIVTRIAEPLMHPNENLVDVNYHLLIRNKSNGKIKEMDETHQMRYFFKPEIESFFKLARLELISCEEWMTRNTPGFDTWSICFMGSHEKKDRSFP